MFEDRFINYIKEFAQVINIGDYKVARDLDKAVETVEAMKNGTEVITQAVLRNPENQTYGLADLLVRLDVLFELNDLFPNVFNVENSSNIDIKDPEMLKMYRVIDIKFSTLKLKVGNFLDSSHKSHMVQLDIYNRALGRVE